MRGRQGRRRTGWP